MSVPIYFGAPGQECNPSTDTTGGGFFGLPPWWKYMKYGQRDILNNCVPSLTANNASSEGKVQNLNNIWPIVLAIADMLIILAGMIAVILIVVAGITFVTSQGEPDKVAKARQRIINALVGLGIIIIASVTVNFIGNTLFK